MANRALNPGMIDKRSVRRQKLDRMRRYRFIYVLMIPALVWLIWLPFTRTLWTAWI